MVYDASVVYSLDVFGERYHFLLQQSMWAGLAISLFLFSFLTPYKFLQKISPILYYIGVLLLIFVLIPTPLSPKIYGAHRWIIFPLFGGLSLQPSDVMKFGYVLYLSILLSKSYTTSFTLIKKFFLATIIPASLIIMQPDFGSALILCASGIAMLFITGLPLKYFLISLPMGILSAIVAILGSNYRRDRLMSFINHSLNSTDPAGYHINQVLIAIGSGGVFGLGWGQSRQKYGYLPEVSADSIFAVVGEELGFLGCTILVLLLFFIIWRGILIAEKCKLPAKKIAVIGIISLFAFQTLLNILSQVKLIPLTGVPLPLISYGGSSLLFTCAGFGVLLSASREC